jgi:hypothetical protein
MREDDIFSMMKAQDLPEHFRIVSETCGIETARTLVRELGGITISIPKLTSLKPLLARYIKGNMDEVSIKKIARDLGMNERAIANTVKRITDK